MRSRSLSILWLATGCAPEAAVLLTVEDPNLSAPEADRIAVGSEPESGEVRALGPRRFPVSMALVGPAGEPALVRVEALDEDAVLARGAAEVFFDPDSVRAITLELQPACTVDADCIDATYCNGVERCNADGVCSPGEPPCPEVAEPKADGGCLIVSCAEPEEACRVDVDDDPCP